MSSARPVFPLSRARGTISRVPMAGWNSYNNSRAKHVAVGPLVVLLELTSYRRSFCRSVLQLPPQTTASTVRNAYSEKPNNYKKRARSDNGSTRPRYCSRLFAPRRCSGQRQLLRPPDRDLRRSIQAHLLHQDVHCDAVLLAGHIRRHVREPHRSCAREHRYIRPR